MAMAQVRPQQTYMAQQGMGRGGPSGLADVLEVLLDKGLVIDAFVRVSLIGIELLTIDARVVVASVDTYLRFAEAVNRLDLLQVNNSQNLGDLIGTTGRDEGRESRALSSHGSGADEAKSDDRDLEPAEAPSRDADDPAAKESGADADDDKGLLTRIKERGQVF